MTVRAGDLTEGNVQGGCLASNPIRASAATQLYYACVLRSVWLCVYVYPPVHLCVRMSHARVMVCRCTCLRTRRTGVARQ